MESFFVPQANSKYLIGMWYKTTVTELKINFGKSLSNLVIGSGFWEKWSFTKSSISGWRGQLKGPQHLLLRVTQSQIWLRPETTQNLHQGSFINFLRVSISQPKVHFRHFHPFIMDGAIWTKKLLFLTRFSGWNFGRKTYSEKERCKVWMLPVV